MTMKSYTAYCMNEDGENLCMTREYTAKAHFISDLHGNGYKVHFVALTDKYDEESAKYHERLETKRRRAAIRRECKREWKRRDAEIQAEIERRVNEENQAEEAEAVKEEETARAEEATNADDYVTPFEVVKSHLFAKVEHIGENFPTGSEWFGKRYGDDIAVTVWIDNGTAKPERLDRGTVHKWIDRHDVTILNRVFNTALENTMANEKPRLYKNIFTTDSAQIEETALLESFYAVKSLPDDKTPMITTSKQNGGAIACFYPPVCAKISELFGGTGFYVSFTSPNEGIIHAPGSIDISSMRRNLRETNNIFGMSGALTNDIFYYDPVMMRLDAVTE